MLQNDLSSGLLHSSSDDNSKNNHEQRAMMTAIATVRCVDQATASDITAIATVRWTRRCLKMTATM